MRIKVTELSPDDIRYGRVELPFYAEALEICDRGTGWYFGELVAEDLIVVAPLLSGGTGYPMYPGEAFSLGVFKYEEAPMYRLLDEDERVEAGDIVMWGDGDEWGIGDGFLQVEEGTVIKEIKGWPTNPLTRLEEWEYIICAVLRKVN